MTVQEDITLWQRLAGEAKAGQLFLDDSVAKRCQTAIDSQLAVYQACLEGVDQMSKVTGLGEFECGKELAKLLGLKAIDPAGDGDLSSALKDHIRVLELMADTIQSSIDRLQEQDSTNSQAYNQI
ncbi:hypothetical protein ACFYT3_22690 [Nocardia amikacinitolerans]|uniref:hypothetical protein n=1 Tax=Nocardia amikacinitolerans TaxID=756689 RepID=UPI0020A31C53|nr:hypothetical protein [Nocardia amikacinitolerans]MCP2291801.1 hypothetical protein [Nocardia amikacinitolerans]